ncbi:L,D-transpeptidase family protein [Alkaliphilus sp. MSJ-5]|uniref:L,D-transpeptidase family protein n=1 Tax=Alkaliphilus flagellatus TaxID=2841507 RepID=A0ABS6G2T5_9FIRM|nr:L,D-transpeptidase family protein [Alkaliphilus flagellatus]MBU5676795.1 L,D-transpeptidase family protein [Alkaliphilus flagellatus]
MLKSIVSGLILSTMIVTPNTPKIDVNIINNAVKTHIQKVISLEMDYSEVLKKLGFNKGEYKNAQLDNRNAILRFQSEHNLTVDGSIGRQTKGAMLKRMLESEYKYTDTVTNPPSNKHWITVNKTKRILTLYKGKDVIKKYPIAQGKDSGLTPEGKFTIVRKTINPSWNYKEKSAKGGAPDNPLGKRWIGISYGGGGMYGIHGNNAPYSIGTNVSLGCVRMINADVEELFEIIQINIPIWIGTDTKFKDWGVNQESYLKTAQ